MNDFNYEMEKERVERERKMKNSEKYKRYLNEKNINKSIHSKGSSLSIDEEYKSSNSNKKSKKEDNNHNENNSKDDLMNQIIQLREQNNRNVIEMKAKEKQLNDREKTIAILRQKDESTEAERKEMMNMNITGSSQLDSNGNHINGYSNGNNKHKIVDDTKFPKKKKMSNEML